MTDPKIRYRVELYTDDRGGWFAQVEWFVGDNPSPGCGWTKTFPTWAEAFAAARKKVEENAR
jgi:hypothetical protein